MAEFEFGWEGPFPLRSVVSEPAAKAPGLYLWGVTSASGYVLYYLGETGKTIAERIRAHMGCYRTGEFGLLDWDAFYRGEWTYLKQSYYRKYTTEARTKFREEKAQWESVIEGEVDRISVFVLPIPLWSGTAYRRMRMRLEQAVGEEITMHWPAGFPNHGNGIDEYKRKNQKEWHYARFEGNESICGLPKQIRF